MLNLKTTVQALPFYTESKNVKLFEKHKVLSESEVRSRMEILLENYSNIVFIEALTAIDMASKEISPAVVSYQKFVIEELNKKCKLDKKLSCKLEKSIIYKLSALSDKFSESLEKLTVDTETYSNSWDNLKKAKYCEEVLLPDMKALRESADAMELIIGKSFQPYPNYEDILYSVKY